LALLIICAIGLWWFFPREDSRVWRFSPDVSLPGGNSVARSIVFSPDGRAVAVLAVTLPAANSRGVRGKGARQRRLEVQLWSLLSHQRQTTLVISDADLPRVTSKPEMNFSRDGRNLRLWGAGTTTWDVATGARLSAAPYSSPSSLPWNAVNAASPHPPWAGNRQLEINYRRNAFSGDGLWCAAVVLNSSTIFSGQSVIFWRRATSGKPWQSAGTIPVTTLHDRIISDLAFNHDGKLLAVSLDNGSLQLFETAHLRLWKSLPSSNWIINVAFSPDDRYLLGCGGSDVRQAYSRRGGVLNFWNVSSGILEHTVTAPRLLRDPVFSPDGKWIAAIEGDATVFVCPSPLTSKRRSKAGAN